MVQLLDLDQLLSISYDIPPDISYSFYLPTSFQIDALKSFSRQSYFNFPIYSVQLYTQS
jgi:hypothetical protein